MGRDPREDRDKPVDEGLPKCNPVLGGDKKESEEATASFVSDVADESRDAVVA